MEKETEKKSMSAVCLCVCSSTRWDRKFPYLSAATYFAARKKQRPPRKETKTGSMSASMSASPCAEANESKLGAGGVRCFCHMNTSKVQVRDSK